MPIRILVVDEPSKGLDRHSLDRLADLLSAHVRDGGLLLTITHDLRLARQLGELAGELEDALLVDVAADRDDEPVRRVGREAEVPLGLDDQLVAVERRREARELVERRRRRLEQQRDHRHLHVALLGVQLLAERLERVAIYIDALHQRSGRQVRLQAQVFEVVLKDTPTAKALVAVAQLARLHLVAADAAHRLAEEKDPRQIDGDHRVPLDNPLHHPVERHAAPEQQEQRPRSLTQGPGDS